MVLLDTNVLSELIKKQPASVLIERLRQTAPTDLYTSVICVAELRMGATLSPKKSSLWKRIETEILDRVQILPVTKNTALFAGDILAVLKAQGRPIGLADVLIGATALQRGFTMVTGNTRHFNRIPELRVENWLASSEA